ncbi:hypothetical protein [Methanocalculus sp.]|uniref:hypothetical protein n=1 Tax=Methanocalculus sp. TaxID=2004547 RepID=UPI0027288010|nr:hypothetical protein [Methanocalculus sp.]MDO8840731.1 hypothetical protein [Methanocalculus sp.]
MSSRRIVYPFSFLFQQKRKYDNVPPIKKPDRTAVDRRSAMGVNASIRSPNLPDDDTRRSVVRSFLKSAHLSNQYHSEEMRSPSQLSVSE